MKKRGISLMISYTLLVVIALALASVVYTYLKLYLPTDLPECPAGINLVVKEADCTRIPQIVNFTLENRGLFSAEFAFIRIGPEGRNIRWQINSGSEAFSTPILPGNFTRFIYNINTSDFDMGQRREFILEVQPGILDKGHIVSCKGASVTFPITCYVP